MSDAKLAQYLRALKEWGNQQPGKRGIDIPEKEYDKILSVAQSRTIPLWGQHPTPQQLQAFYDAGAHDNPALIHGFYESQPHPHAPSIPVGQYPAWKEAHQTWQEHAK